MAKKTEEAEVVEEMAEEVAEEAPAAPVRVAHDFLREDLNDLRDAVNELHARG